MLVLFETSGGYAIFKVLKEKKLRNPENLYMEFQSAEKAHKVLALRHFEKFQSMEEALESASCSIKGKMSKKMKKFLKGLEIIEAEEELAVADAKLGNAINSKLNINCVTNNAVGELNRCIRGHLNELLDGLPEKELTAMTLGVAHGLSRYKFKFSPDKIDKMVIEAVSALDDLDKELNNYIMRCKEWYGWHFPELSKVISDNRLYIKTVLAIGFRDNTVKTDLSDILSEEEAKVKSVAEISMGTDITDEDLLNIKNLCEEVLEMQQCRAKLYEYLKNRMAAIAPNVTSLVGEMVGARLIAHAGSLVNLAKHPASTVQILGAEKALFRALKARHDTPKYGLIYHAQLIGQSNTALKGKMSRMLAAKTALACRVDVFAEEDIDVGADHRARLERALQQLEQGKSTRISGSGKFKGKFDKYENKSMLISLKSSSAEKFNIFFFLLIFFNYYYCQVRGGGQEIHVKCNYIPVSKRSFSSRSPADGDEVKKFHDTLRFPEPYKNWNMESKTMCGEITDCSVKSVDCMEAVSNPSPSASYKWAQSLQCLLEDIQGVNLFEKFLKQEGQDTKFLSFLFACRGMKKHDPSDREGLLKLIKIIFEKGVKRISAISDETKEEIKQKLLSTLDVYNTIFDVAMRDVEAYMMKTTYPNFLRSDLYIQHLREWQDELSPEKECALTPESSVAVYLPTVHEDAELQISSNKIPPLTKSNILLRYKISSSSTTSSSSSKFKPEGPG